MATIPRPSDPRAFDRTKVRKPTVAGPFAAFAAMTAAGFREPCNVLAQLIDISLTVACLLSSVVLAASLGFMIAGQIVG